jgi:hypothetical protein
MADPDLFGFELRDCVIALDCPICHRRRLEIREGHDG